MRTVTPETSVGFVPEDVLRWADEQYPRMASWDEDLHPRGEGGRFTTGDSGGEPEPHLTSRDYEGEVGNRDHITRVEEGTIPTAAIATLEGVNGEQPGQHGARQREGADWDEFLDSVREHGITDPIFITVDYGQAPKISEGNTRRDAAVELGLPEVPVEIRYFGHAEQEGTVVERAGLGAALASWDEGLHPRGEGGKFTFKDDSEDEPKGPSSPAAGVSDVWDRMPDDQRAAVLAMAEKWRLDYNDMHARAAHDLDLAARIHELKMVQEEQAPGFPLRFLDPPTNSIPFKGDPVEQGTGWYEHVREQSLERYDAQGFADQGVSFDAYCAVVAACSARTPWDDENGETGEVTHMQNLDNADHIIGQWLANPDVEVTASMLDAASTKDRTYDVEPGTVIPLQEMEPNLGAAALREIGGLYAKLPADEFRTADDASAHLMMPHAVGSLDALGLDARGESPFDALHGAKEGSFGPQIASGGTGSTAVIDSLMTAALSGREVEQKGGAASPLGKIDAHITDSGHPDTTPGPRTQYKNDWVPEGRVYTLFDAAVRQAADERGLSVSDAQAIVWYTQRDYGLDALPADLKEKP